MLTVVSICLFYIIFCTLSEQFVLQFLILFVDNFCFGKYFLSIPQNIILLFCYTSENRMDMIVLWVIIPFHAPLCNPETTADPIKCILLSIYNLFLRLDCMLGIEKNLGMFIFVSRNIEVCFKS